VNKDHLHSLLKPLFPNTAHFRHLEQYASGLTYRVDWKIRTKDRPNKHSRPIEIFFSSESIENYEPAPRQSVRDEIDGQVVRSVKASLSTFNPDHDAPRYQRLPAERCVIGTDFVSY
jgi:hypothetical protein